jgi:hypothetical protein
MTCHCKYWQATRNACYWMHRPPTRFERFLLLLLGCPRRIPV